MGGAFFFPKSLLLLTLLIEFLVEFADRTEDAAPDSARDLESEDPLSLSISSKKRLV